MTKLLTLRIINLAINQKYYYIKWEIKNNTRISRLKLKTSWV